jgi:hypothetical protein
MALPAPRSARPHGSTLAPLPSESTAKQSPPSRTPTSIPAAPIAPLSLSSRRASTTRRRHPDRSPNDLRELADDAGAQATPPKSRQRSAPRRARRSRPRRPATRDAGTPSGAWGEAHYDSAERRTGMAAELGRLGVRKETVNVRIGTEVSQGGPAFEAPPGATCQRAGDQARTRCKPLQGACSADSLARWVL